MQETHPIDGDFIDKITAIIEENISDEKFGVSELASETGMSRSNLLRKVKKLTKLSVSQFVRQIRLKKAMEMLRQTSLNVSEISYKVGFGSTSYFIKCFRDYYGYPPGEVGKRDMNADHPISGDQPGIKRRTAFIGITIATGLIIILLFIFFDPLSTQPKDLEKSIAVLPFQNDSNDSTNVYIINGLMESILNNLQKIEDLRVISRTSVEKYRTSPRTIPEIAKELNVNYLIEGSGQKIDDQILLSVQLIEAPGDKHLWSSQYDREAKDIFNLQNEVAKSIAAEIKAIITPEEAERIDKVPTEDLVAYDYFLKGLDLLNKRTHENLKDAIPNFLRAIEHDNDFARAYAAIAMAYYFLDENQVEKEYADSINRYADKALLLDSQLPQSLIAKALFYMHNGEYELAVSYFEKALEYNPNYDLVFAFLVDLYVNHLPNTEKYLEYALKGLQLDIGSYDSVTQSFSYLHISNAFAQSGFVKEAEKYIDKSLAYYPQNLYSEYVKAFILYAKNKDLFETKRLLIDALKKDTTRLDIIQEVGKICYYMRDFESAYFYYRRFIDVREALKLDIYPGENAKIAIVLSEMGRVEESEKYFNAFRVYAEKDKSIYKPLSLAAYYSYMGDTDRAIENLRVFSEQDNYHYWILLFLEIDPLVDNIKNLPEFQNILNEIETKFRNYHEQIRSSLEEEELI